VGLSLANQLISLSEVAYERNHAAVITRQVEAVLADAGIIFGALDGVVLSEGPGSYTSLRVGMSTAKGICFALDLPLLVVNTLEALASAALTEVMNTDYICPMIDARRMEVYASLYDTAMNPLIDNAPLVLEENSFDSYLQEGRSICLCGNGAEKTRSLFSGRNIRILDLKCSARHLVEPGYRLYREAKFADLAYFSPNYVKSPNITQAKKRLL